MIRLFALAGWLLAAAAVYALGRTVQLFRAREVTLWGQLDRYQRLITPDRGFDDHGNVVDDTEDEPGGG